jgi:hypothetical protein
MDVEGQRYLQEQFAPAGIFTDLLQFYHFGV